jgi:lysine-specific demethylase 8
MNIIGSIDRLTRSAGWPALGDYLQRGEPVILSGVCSDWPAIQAWSPEYFNTVFGHVPVKYRVSRSNVHPDLNNDDPEHIVPIAGTMAAFLRLISSSNEDKTQSRYYLTGDNRTMSLISDGQINAIFRTLLDDIRFPPHLNIESVNNVGLWLSAAGARSWLHYDTMGMHNLNVQISGRKRILLFPPDDLKNMYPFSITSFKGHNFSRVNVEFPDYDLFPRFRDANAIDGLLSPGDCLFLPAFWFHTFGSEAAFNTNVTFWWKAEHIVSTVTSLRSAFLHHVITLIKRYKQDQTELPPAVMKFLQEYDDLLCSADGVDYF